MDSSGVLPKPAQQCQCLASKPRLNLHWCQLDQGVPQVDSSGVLPKLAQQCQCLSSKPHPILHALQQSCYHCPSFAYCGFSSRCALCELSAGPEH